MGLILYCDGSVEPFNPGGVATYGVSAVENGKEVDTIAEFLAEGPGVTNNQTEYLAINRAVQLAIWHYRLQEPIEIRSDSQLAIRQLRGEYQVNAPLLRPLWEEIRELVKELRTVTFTWIPRLQNRRADFLARKAYREHVTSHGTACVGWGTV